MPKSLGFYPKMWVGKVSQSLKHDDLSNALKLYARSRWPMANDKWRKERLADLFQMTSRRIRSLWEGETSARPDEDELSRIEQITGINLRGTIDGGPSHEAETQDQHLAGRLAALEAQVAILAKALGGQIVARSSEKSH